VTGMPEPLIRDVSDTARWVAVYRARESERPDAVFRDPYARRLAGDRGEQIADALPFGQQNAWSWTARTYLVDRLVAAHVAAGGDLVVNLAAGLDARPYRMDLPPTLRWVEVDLPRMIDYKTQILAGETPRCQLERVGLDLADVPARRALFERLGRSASNALVVSEGLLIYLSRAEVEALAHDLAAQPSFRGWVIDICSPGLLTMMQKRTGNIVERAAPFRFAPTEGPAFFTSLGWTPREVHSMLKAGAALKRLPLWMKLLALLPEPKQPVGSRPWSAVCLLAR
jgi:methyltransferase (TIGR00027 family)